MSQVVIPTGSISSLDYGSSFFADLPVDSRYTNTVWRECYPNSSLNASNSYEFVLKPALGKQVIDISKMYLMIGIKITKSGNIAIKIYT